MYNFKKYYKLEEPVLSFEKKTKYQSEKTKYQSKKTKYPQNTNIIIKLFIIKNKITS